MTVFPLATVIPCPSIVMLTVFLFLKRQSDASLLLDVRFELGAVFLDKSSRRHRGRISERANRIAHNVPADTQDQVQIPHGSLPIFDAAEDLFHPIATLAAGSALAA